MTGILPNRHRGLEVADFEVEFVVFDPRVLRVHHLVGVVAVVFDACDGLTVMDDLVGELAGAIGSAAPEAARSVEEALGALRAAGLIDGTEPATDGPPCLGCGGEDPPPVLRRRLPRRSRRQ